METPEKKPNSAFSEPVEKKALDQLRAMMEEDFAETLQLYLDHSQTLIAAIREACAKNDPEAFSSVAHTLKGSSADIGARRLADICRELEAMGKSGELKHGMEGIQKLEAEYARVREQLEGEDRNGSLPQG